jgi:hypothetical protein
MQCERDEKKPRVKMRKKIFKKVIPKVYAPTEEPMCERQRTSFRHLTPGIMTIFCEHSICHGFMLFHEHESVAHVFNIFFMRMQKAPKMIIYDRACQLAVYCLKRAPNYFANTIFRIDALHFKTHIDCSDGYDVETYQQDDMVSSNDNATFIDKQICEQNNAVLKNIRVQCAFMTQDRFLIYTRLLIYYFNLAKKSKNMLM